MLSSSRADRCADLLLRVDCFLRMFGARTCAHDDVAGGVERSPIAQSSSASSTGWDSRHPRGGCRSRDASTCGTCRFSTRDFTDVRSMCRFCTRPVALNSATVKTSIRNVAAVRSPTGTRCSIPRRGHSRSMSTRSIAQAAMMCHATCILDASHDRCDHPHAVVVDAGRPVHAG